MEPAEDSSGQEVSVSAAAPRLRLRPQSPTFLFVRRSASLDVEPIYTFRAHR